jgi:hypothetical protein
MRTSIAVASVGERSLSAPVYKLALALHFHLLFKIAANWPWVILSLLAESVRKIPRRGVCSSCEWQTKWCRVEAPGEELTLLQEWWRTFWKPSWRVSTSCVYSPHGLLFIQWLHLTVSACPRKTELFFSVERHLFLIRKLVKRSWDWQTDKS